MINKFTLFSMFARITIYFQLAFTVFLASNPLIVINWCPCKFCWQCTASISDCPISHSSQLTNPFLGLPLEFGKCESCGTSEAGKCEGQYLSLITCVCVYDFSLFYMILLEKKFEFALFSTSRSFWIHPLANSYISS